MKLYYVAQRNMSFVPHLRTIKEETGIDPFPIKLLLSYFFLKKTSLDKVFENVLEPHEIDLFIDSGAYSAFTQRVRIDVEKYADWIKKNQHWMTQYANLDVKHSATEGEYNLRFLEKEGLSPIPVWHGGESAGALSKMASQYNHIAIGGIVGKEVKRTGLTKFLQAVSNIVKDNGSKAHMFGVGNWNTLSKVDFHSADSTSFEMSRWGKVCLWDDTNFKIERLKFASKEILQYEHIFAQYGLPTSPLMMKRPGSFGYPIIRAFQYMEFQKMAASLSALWDVRRKHNVV